MAALASQREVELKNEPLCFSIASSTVNGERLQVCTGSKDFTITRVRLARLWGPDPQSQILSSAHTGVRSTHHTKDRVGRCLDTYTFTHMVMDVRAEAAQWNRGCSHREEFSSLTWTSLSISPARLPAQSGKGHRPTAGQCWIKSGCWITSQVETDKNTWHTLIKAALGIKTKLLKNAKQTEALNKTKTKKLEHEQQNWNMLQTTRSKTQLKIQKLNKKTFGKTTERGKEVWDKKQPHT